MIILVANTAIAQNTKYYASFGLENIVDDDFNSKLTKRSIAKITEPVYTIGIGRQMGNERQGLLFEFHYFFSKDNKYINSITDLSGGQIFIYTPFSNLYKNQNFNIMLSSGFGFGILKFGLRDNTNKFDYRNFSLFVKIESGIDYSAKRISPGRDWIIGVRFGYNVHIYGSDWRLNIKEAPEIPILRTKGAYIKLIFGLSNLYTF